MVTYLRKRTLAHINCDVTSRTFLFICHEKGRPEQGQEGDCDWAALVSFGAQIDREVVTMMSGRHWMISLRNLIN